MRINRFVMPLVVIVALLGAAFVAQAAGIWTTSGRDTVHLAQLQPADLKGWMTLQQVIDGLPISQNALYALAQIPADVPATTALKDLEEVISVTELRDLLTARAGTAVPAGQRTSSVPTAAPTAQPTVGPATPVATAVHTGSGTGDGTGTGPTPLPAGQILPADQIKGRMTLREVSEQCAVPLDKLLAGLKLAPDTDPNTALKDLIGAGRIAEVTAVQQVVAELQK